MIIDGPPLTGPDGSGHPLFELLQDAINLGLGVDITLPAGTITMNGKTYMMVVGTTKPSLDPVGGSWLVEVTDDFSKPWAAVPNSWRPWTPGGGAPTQISGYQKGDNVYIAADSFDRGQGVTMYQVDLAHGGDVADRSTWQPWTGNGWGVNGQAPAVVSPAPFGELSFRELDGQSVLSGFNAGRGGPDGVVEIRVANSPTEIFKSDTTTTVAQQTNTNGPPNVPGVYGGYILPVPGTTLGDMKILVSQWGVGQYNSQEITVNAAPP